MKYSNVYLVGIAALLMIVAMSSLSAAQQYTVTDLGAFGKSSRAYGINDRGQVVGESTLPGSGKARAFLWSAGAGLLDLGVAYADDTSSLAFAVNNSGQVVGESVGN